MFELWSSKLGASVPAKEGHFDDSLLCRIQSAVRSLRMRKVAEVFKNQLLFNRNYFQGIAVINSSQVKWANFKPLGCRFLTMFYAKNY